MTDDYDPYVMRRGEEMTEAGQAAVYHMFEHLYGGALCILGSDEAMDDGFYLRVKDKKNRTWTFSLIPEDGGKVQAAMLKGLLEEDQ